MSMHVLVLRMMPIVACTHEGKDAASEADADSDADSDSDSDADSDGDSDSDCDSDSESDTAGDGDTSTPEPDLEPGDYLVVFEGVSTYVHVPSDSRNAPLLVFLHGSNGAGTWDGSTWRPANPINLVKASEELAFVLAVPGVSTSVDDHDWTFDDAGALQIDAVLAGVQAETSIDAALAFVVGVSKGGAMATWYGLNHPWHARGIATVCGGYPFDYPDQEPDPKLPFYIAHDPMDPEVPYSSAVQLAEDLDAHGHAVLFEDWELGDKGHGWNPHLPEPILDFLIPN
jgi:predicted esterase